MLAITIIVISFLTALLGVWHGHAAGDTGASYWGLSRLGLALMILASVGMVFGVAKEVSGILSAKRVAQRESERTELLKEIHAQVVGAKAAAGDPVVAEQLGKLAERISAAASVARESDFSMSDFSRSDFSMGNFTEASFRDALFRAADLRGADMSGAIIDERTRLPSK